jgi:hypothetical protein
MRNAIFSFSLSALTSLLLFAIPAYSAWSANQLQHLTMDSVNGPRLYYLLAIPMIIAGVPLLLRARIFRALSALLLIGWVVVGSATVGLFYLPSAVMMILAARTPSFSAKL